MPRKKVIPDARMAEQVEQMAAWNVPYAQIARILKTTEQVLDRLYKQHFELGRLQADAKVRRGLFIAATTPGPRQMRAIELWGRGKGWWEDDKPDANANQAASMAAFTDQLSHLSPLEMKVMAGMLRKMGGTLPGDGGGPPLIDGTVDDDDEEED